MTTSRSRLFNARYTSAVSGWDTMGLLADTIIPRMGYGSAETMARYTLGKWACPRYQCEPPR